MSSADPPSRLPRGHLQPAKTAEDIAEARKVEKIREIDSDEQTRQKFRAMMGDEAEEPEKERPPSPFESVFIEKPSTTRSRSPINISETHASDSDADLGDVEDAIIASPEYTPPPSVSIPLNSAAGADEEEPLTGLPKSEKFWEDIDLPPDKPLPRSEFREMGEKRVIVGGKAEEARKGQHEAKKAKKEEPNTFFGPPGKPIEEKKIAGWQDGQDKKGGKTKKELPSLFDEVAKPVVKGHAKESQAKEKTADIRVPHSELEKPTAKKRKKEEDVDAIAMGREPNILPMQKGGGESDSGSRQRPQHKVGEVASPSLQNFPTNVQPLAQTATSQALSYIHPSTTSLFFQMVGTMYVMAAPPGINRTEIVLNNPAFAGSKFFGSTITIEKYATAPDTFNIRLSGTNEAVVAFKENIPSLMTAFQNSNLPFRVHRIDVEYAAEKPVFRRKEKGEDRGEAGGGDLGERRK